MIQKMKETYTKMKFDTLIEKTNQNIKNSNNLKLLRKKKSSIDKTNYIYYKLISKNQEKKEQEYNMLLVESERFKYPHGKNKNASLIPKVKSSSYLKKSKNFDDNQLIKSPDTISRNSSNITNLDYQLDKNAFYLNLERENQDLKNDESMKSNLNKKDFNQQITINKQLNNSSNRENIKNIINKNKNKIPRSITYHKNLCKKIDKNIYNSILTNINKSLLKSKKIQNKHDNEIQKSFKNQIEFDENKISNNSFNIKLEVNRNDFIIDNYDEHIKKFKINANNYTGNINGYAPLVKKTEIKNNNIYNYYEYKDENNNKIAFKTKVLESSELLNKNDEKNIFSFEAYNIQNNIKELKSFKWDNLPAYIVKQEKLAKKQSIDKEPVKKLNIFALFSNAFKNILIKKIDIEKLKKAFGIFLISLILQLILSRK